ncbi:MAG: hypothetical protein V1811_03020, partial [Candidatus Micrarchaeota archaeon]
MQKALRKLIKSGLASPIPAWWHLSYQPIRPRYGEGPGKDVRKLISLKEFKAKQLDLGEHDVLDMHYGNRTGQKLNIRVFNSDEIPVVIVPVKVGGEKLDVLVTQRPLSAREGNDTVGTARFFQRLADADAVDAGEFIKMTRGEPFDETKVLP